MIATEAALGVKPAEQVFVLHHHRSGGRVLSRGFNPTQIYVTANYVRAAKGGVGEAKTSGNYGASSYASKLAAKKG